MNEVAEKSQGDSAEEIYAWIDRIPFSRPTRNIPRDFSDAVLMAEVLKVYYPRYVDVHNYISANSVQTKRDNWSTLNRKVLSKIDMKLSKGVMNQLASAQPGTIEKVLMDLRNKISRDIDSEGRPLLHNLEEPDPCDTTDEENRGNADERETTLERKSSNVVTVAAKVSDTYVGVTRRARNGVAVFIAWLVGWICFWRWFLENRKRNDLEVASEDSAVKEEKVARVLYEQLKQELLEKDETIDTLTRKIEHLEDAMKPKDQRIASPTCQINSNDISQNTRPHVIGSGQLKLRQRSPQI